MLRNIVGSKMEDVTGGWIKLHNEKLNDLNSTSNNVR
jgi:hypothetical protein